MAILDYTGESAAASSHSRALDLFTDRLELRRLFLSYLNDDPARATILFLHGDGGNGKSLLLRFLTQHYAKRFRSDSWTWLRDQPLDDLIAHADAAEGAEPVPLAFLDLGSPPRGDDRPQEGFSALMSLRRQLGAATKIDFPTFDYASVLYLHRSGALDPARVHTLFPPREHAFVQDLVVGIAEFMTPGAKAIGKALKRRFGDTLDLRRRAARLDDDEVERIARLEPRSELPMELSALFARDLNEWAANDRRAVLGFDTHEAFWGAQSSLPPDLYFERDEWLRCLLASLDLDAGIVAVVAGREPPRWHEASRFTIPRRFVDAHHVGELSASDADTYLLGAGIDDVEMREAIVRTSSIGDRACHPLYLAMCADTVLAAAHRGNPIAPEELDAASVDPASAIVDRLLRYADADIAYVIRALSAARSFDLDVAIDIAGALGLKLSPPTFGSLTRLSIVRPDPLRPGWFRIHDLLRSLFERREDPVLRNAHAALESLYTGRTVDARWQDQLEAAYHANRIDAARGIDRWRAVAENAVDVDDPAQIRAVLEVRSLMLIPDRLRGQVGLAAAQSYAAIARYEDAEAEIASALAALEAEESAEAVWLLAQRAEIAYSRVDHDALLPALEAALAFARDRASQNGSSETRTALARILALAAVEYYELADATAAEAHAFEALEHLASAAPDHPMTHRARKDAALVLAGLGAEPGTDAWRHQALDAANAALELTPESVTARLQVAEVLTGAADPERVQDPDDVEPSAQAALDHIEAALDAAPRAPLPHSLASYAHQLVGWARTERRDHRGAIAALGRGVASAEHALDARPGYVPDLLNLSSALSYLAQSMAAGGDPRSALAPAERALHVIERSSDVDSNPRLAYERILASGVIAALRLALGDLDTAQDLFERAADSYESMMADPRAPKFIWNDVALMRCGVAEMLLRRGKAEAALANAMKASAASEQAAGTPISRTNPDIPHAHALRLIGTALQELGREAEGREAARRAIDRISEAVDRSPERWSLRFERARCLVALAQVAEGDDERRRLIDEARSILQQAPADQPDAERDQITERIRQLTK